MKRIVLALLLTVFFAVPAFSQMMDMPMMEHRDGPGMMGDMMGMCLKHAEMMGLTDDQMNKMKPVHFEMQKKQARYKADLKIAMIELMEIMEVKDFDLEKATAGVKKIEGIKTAHHLEMFKAMKEMRAVLTDEQFKKMKKMMPMEMGEKKPAGMMMKP
ncbi:MAG: Spy/CpxP family protein refolding chaperone [Desulfobulbaceae bacterium]|nr:Spy/CpxP family protein refolding chaperone [Desulfobulbaceae bacterium]